MRPGLLRWQWEIYARGHQNRRNLVVHAWTVPWFMAGTLLAARGLLSLAPQLVAGGVALMAAALAVQGRTHRRESTRPEPFRGPGDFVLRVFAEQWITFPRFVLSGAFARALRQAPAAAEA